MSKITLPKGLYIPISTPMNEGAFDEKSYSNLMDSVEDHVDGFVPCLSSGEGQKMSIELRKKVLSETLINTQKPVYVGIKRNTKDEVLELFEHAKEMGATGITTPVICKGEADISTYIKELAGATDLPIIIYNTEEQHISDIDTLKEIDSLENIVAIKDSSMNDAFFGEMIQAKKSGSLKMSVFQGMEHKLHCSLEADGFLISLANVESKLAKEYLLTGDASLGEKIKKLFWKYNLGGEWYISLKAILLSRGIIESAEEINPYLKF